MLTTRPSKLSRSRSYPRRDMALRKIVDELSAADADYWSFRGRAGRSDAHAYFQYPAMMVPEMQRDLIGAVVSICPEIKSVFDPFVGSGTVLTETMLRGLGFLGADINPLAILLCRAKAGPFFVNATRQKVDDLLARIANDSRDSLETGFPGLEKWFDRDVAVELSRIHRAITREDSLWCRQFFWVALAETVRTTSNSRTSTFKLHIRPAAELALRRIRAVPMFEQALRRNLDRMAGQAASFAERGLIKRGRYVGSVEIQLRDAREPLVDSTMGTCDLLVSSPPYGDNASTVPYGQHSFLPLQWIDLSDIDVCLRKDWLATTHEIDHRSLGGSRRLEPSDSATLREISPHFRSVLQVLNHEPRDRAVRVAAFCRDLNHSLGPILSTLKPNAYMVWTIGNRRVGGQSVPLDGILSDLLLARGAVAIATIQRRIPTKRMALKNSITTTMASESILIFRKAGVHCPSSKHPKT